MNNGDSQDNMSKQTQADVTDSSVNKTVKKLMLIVVGMVLVLRWYRYMTCFVISQD